VHITGSSPGQGANSQFGPVLPTALPSGQSFASSVHAFGWFQPGRGTFLHSLFTHFVSKWAAMPVQKSGQSLDISTFFEAYNLLPTKQLSVFLSMPPQVQSASTLQNAEFSKN
jgi:hypothetical protein